MSTSVILAILVTSLATFSSRLLGVISSEGIKETSKLFRWFNCLAYSTLAALIAVSYTHLTLPTNREV